MAAVKKQKLDYQAILGKLHKNGPDNLYFLWGEEDYLRDAFLDEIKKLCLGDGDDSFNSKRLDGPKLDLSKLSEAVETPPFMSERSFIEVRDFDIDKCKDKEAKELDGIISDLPSYCTLVFTMTPTMKLDNRRKALKNLKDKANAIEFTAQSQSDLTNWLKRRFQHYGKSIDSRGAERLIYLSGSSMNSLIPEIDKIAFYAKGERITVEDIDAVTARSPESKVFDMVDALAAQNYDSACKLLSDALYSDESPFKIIGLISRQFRLLYTAKLAREEKLGMSYVKEVTGAMDFVIRKLQGTVDGFTIDRLREDVALCTETEMEMKTSTKDKLECMRELIMRL